MTRRSHERTALFPGTFNPFTIGHQSILDRALTLFDRVVVGVGFNIAKPEGGDDARRRADVIAGLYAGDPRVSAVAYSGLTVDACRAHGAQFIVRGVRNVADFEYERTLADINRRIAGIETVLLYTLPELSSVSSSMVRELEAHGVDVSRFLPKSGKE